MFWLKLYLQTLQFFSQKLAAEKMHKLMSSPQIRKPKSSEDQVLETAKTSIRKFQACDIQQYEWGDRSQPTALLVHGWEGQAGNFAALIPMLESLNYHIIAVDGPAHGKSTIIPTNMFQFADLVQEIATEFNPKLIISHSFGSVVTATMLRNTPQIKIDQWVMITTPNRFEDRITQVADFFGVDKRTLSYLIPIIETEAGDKISSMTMTNYCPKLENVSNVLIVHSKSDRILKIDGARQVNESMPNCDLIELENLGHYSILWSDALHKILMNHLVPINPGDN